LGVAGQQVLQGVGEVVEAAELGDDDGLDVAAEVGGDLGVGELVGADALAVVLDGMSGSSRAATCP
jgi:hypothetical protein